MALVELIPTLILAIAFLAREYTHYKAEQAAQAERNLLLQRVQAPREVAYREFSESLPKGASPVPVMTDEDAWAALNGLKAKAE